MENILDYIILIVVIGISLIGSVAKRKKAQNNRTEPRPPVFSDPWEEIETRTLEPLPERFTAPPPIHTRVGTSVTSEIMSRNRELGSGLTVSSIQDNSEQSEILREGNLQPSSWLDRHNGSIDLETAVVYTEILKPKFED